jgi:hypothetical protein
MLASDKSLKRRSVMSQVTQPTIPLTAHVRSPGRKVWLAAVIALTAIAAVVLVLALNGESPKTDSAGTADVKAQPSARTDGGPEETSVAASVGSRPTAGPDEARIAGSIASATPEVSSGPDESRLGHAALMGTAPAPARPDESRTAANISGR